MRTLWLRGAIALVTIASCLSVLLHSRPSDGSTSAILQTETDKHKMIVDQSISGSVYRSGAGHFTLTVPEGWSTNEDIAEPKLGIGGLSSPGNEAQLEIQQFPTGDSPATFSKKIDAKGTSLFHGYRKLGESQLEVAGRHCEILTFEFVQEPQVAGSSIEMKLVSRFVLMPNDFSIFVFNFVTPEALFDKQLPAVEEILKSFHSTAKEDSAPRLK